MADPVTLARAEEHLSTLRSCTPFVFNSQLMGVKLAELEVRHHYQGDYTMFLIHRANKERNP